MKLDILAIGVHPDDVELSCSGTLLKHIKMKRAVGILDLTKGELGTRGNAALRTKEAMNAAKLMKVKIRTQLDMADGFFVNDEKHQRKIVEQIRFHKPEVVFANAIEDRHPDHGRAAKLISDACFLSGLAKVETKYKGKKQEAWRPKAVYHYIQDNYIHPDFVIDVTDFMNKKMEAIMAFSSQFYDPKSKEPQTPISTKEFLEVIKAKNALWGRAIGVPYAEGFTSNKYIGVDSVFDLL